MLLDLVGFISTHFQPKPSHGDPFQTKFWPNCQPYIVNKDLMFLISDGFNKSKKMRNVHTIIFHQVSRRDLCYVSENEGFRFVKKSIF